MKIKDYILGNSVFQGLFKKLHQVALMGMNYGYANNYENNGEVYALKRVQNILTQGKGRKLILMDVGANVGKYTQSILEVFKGQNFELHVFEPSPGTFSVLSQNIRKSARVHLHNIGLSNKKDSAVLFTSEEKSSLASLYDRNLSHTSLKLTKEEKIHLDSLDNFCAENNIETIDFLKTDVEGHELKVFEGARKMLTNNAIKIIQFEFGGCNIDSRTYFKDFFLLLQPQYHLYRIVKNGLVPLNRYSEDYEVFKSSNFLAILKKGT